MHGRRLTCTWHIYCALTASTFIMERLAVFFFFFFFFFFLIWHLFLANFQHFWPIFRAFLVIFKPFCTVFTLFLLRPQVLLWKLIKLPAVALQTKASRDYYNQMRRRKKCNQHIFLIIRFINNRDCFLARHYSNLKLHIEDDKAANGPQYRQQLGRQLSQVVIL